MTDQAPATPTRAPRPAPAAPTRNERRIAWLLGAISVALFATYFIVQPPFDGDAYEHAEVAKNLLQRGELVQDHHHYPSLTHLPLPVGDGRRLSLYVGLQMPFQAAFGSSALVVILPFLFALLFIPRVALGALGPVFGGRATLLSSAVLVLHPQLLMYFVSDPNVEPPLTLSVLLGFWAFRQRRFVACGLALGIGALIKPTALVIFGGFGLAVLLAGWTYLRRKDLWLGGLLCLAIAAPLLAWTQYALSQGRMAEGFLTPLITPEIIRGDTIAHFFHIHHGLWEVPANTFSDWLDIVQIAAGSFLTGNTWFLGYHQGALEMLGWLLLPLMPIGFLTVRDRLDRVAIILAVVLFLLANMTITVIGAEPRLLMPILAFTGAAAFAGLLRLLPERIGPRLAISVAFFEAATGVVAILAMVSHLATVNVDGYEEYRSITPALPDGDGPMIVMPHLAFSYFHDERVLPIPLGPMTDVLELAKQRDAKGVVMFRYQPGSCLPYDPGFRTVAETQRFCIYALDAPPDVIAKRMTPQLRDFQILNYQLGDGADGPRPLRSASGLAIDAMGPFSFAWFIFWLGLAAAVAFIPRRWGLLAVIVVSFVGSVGTYFVYFSDRVEGDEGRSFDTNYPRTHEELRADVEVPDDLELLYRPFDLRRDDGQFACVIPTRAGATCPFPFERLTCAGGAIPTVPETGKGLIVGCPEWGEGGTQPLGEEAARLTIALHKRLDAEAKEMRRVGWNVRRFNRMLLAFPASAVQGDTP